MEPIRFAQITDTHLGPSPDFSYRGRNAYACTRAIVRSINSMPRRPDFVFHTGDVSNDASPESYVLAHKVFAELEVPFCYCPGNHDEPELLRRYVPMIPPVPLDCSCGEGSYAFSLLEHRIICMDAKGGPELGAHGEASQEALSFLEEELTLCDSAAVFMHFPALRMFSPWLDEDMRLVNGDEVHAVLARFSAKVRGVFVGHIHQDMQVLCDGIVYFAAPSATFQLTGSPADRTPGDDVNSPPGYSIVTIAGHESVVRTQGMCGIG